MLGQLFAGLLVVAVGGVQCDDHAVGEGKGAGGGGGGGGSGGGHEGPPSPEEIANEEENEFLRFFVP
jgi:hypothetical protein